MIETQLLVRLRRQLHQYPEVSGNEFNTAATIKDFLRQHAKGTCIDLTNAGFLWRIDSGKTGKTITFRAELDALPIQEINDFEYASVNPGVSHKCGHDGHATILCGAILRFSVSPPQSGVLQFLFQPAEENGEGAKEVLASEMHLFHTDYIFTLHNLPGFPTHQVIYKSGSFSSAVRSIIINLKGKTAHAAEPENGINPASAIAEIVQKITAMSINEPENKNFALAVPIHIHMGEMSYGVSAGEGSCHFTLRTFSNHRLSSISKQAESIAREIAKKYGLSCDIGWTEEFSATENNVHATEIICKAAHRLKLDMTQRHFPFRWGEDFGLFTQRFKGAMFGLGAGENMPALHNPDYDFPDELIETGIDMFAAIAEQTL